MDHSQYQLRRQSRGVCGIRPASMNRRSIDSHQQHRQPLAELDPNTSRVHPGLGPLVSLAEAQARPDIRMRGFLPSKRAPIEKSEASSKTTSQVFPLGVPKRKPVPTRQEDQVESVAIGRPDQGRQLKRRPVASVSNNGEREPQKDITSIDLHSAAPSNPQKPFPRKPVQVLMGPFQSPGKVWRQLELESKGAIKAWPNNNLGSPSSSQSPGKVWRRLETETDGVIEAWSRDVNTQRRQ